MLTFEMLLEHANKKELKVYNRLNAPNTYVMANILPPTGTMQTGTIYICYVSELQNHNLHHSKIGLILIPDLPLDKQLLIDCEYVIWEEPTSLTELFYKIHGIFCENNSYFTNASQLFSTLINGNGISAIVKAASMLLNNPIILTNACYRVLAMHGETDEMTDPIWQYAKKYGYCSQEAIEKFRLEKITAKTMESEAPLIFSQGLAKEIPRMIKKIEVQGRVVGYIGVYQVNKEFDKQDMYTLDLLEDVLAFEMKKEGIEDFNQVNESIIIDLLNHRLGDSHVLESRLRTARWQLKPLFAVIQIPLSKEDDTIWFLDYLVSSLKECNADLKIVSYQNNIIVVINCEDRVCLQKNIENITKVLETNQMKAGMSNIFHRLEELASYYEQAGKALELLKWNRVHDDSMLYFYEDVALYHLFSAIEQQEILEGVCHRGYRELQEYDRLYQTNYCQTLYEYFLSGNNISAAADKLYIHRNTMSYRLQKISEMIHIDLTNGEEAFQLFLTIKIQQWLCGGHEVAARA
ncbi:helix-turn-helix domain-containing protein [Bacillus sp. B15-48]|uniref:PucR family transcriptional regulator n=1 Tax=Bacillus sp. B15-48 TaxID=1548601 RepID=UPI00193F4CF8|nr:helix-turn-helix domain-containing protein [Bacillus sp. B15-48]MBM4763179.1 hypothetical protein [Bacillus sp. B15-48]